MPMYNLLECNWRYSDTTGSLWFYYKEVAINFNANIARNVSFKYNNRLIESTDADRVSEILRNATIAVPLKYKVFGDHLKCHWLIAKWNWIFSGQTTVFYLQMVVVILLIILFSLLKTPIYIFQQSHYQQDQLIGMNVKRKLRIKI